MMRLNPRIQVKYVTSEQFVTEFIRSVRERQGYQFQRKYRDVDVLLVDDIQFLARAEETQTEFFHTFNALHGRERQIVIASRPAAPGALRARGAPAEPVPLGPVRGRAAARPGDPHRDPADEGHARRHRTSRTRCPTSSREKIEHNIRELEGALLRVAAFASLSREPIELPLAERALEDLLPEGGHEISAELIIDETADYFGLQRDDLLSKNRSRPLTTARHMAMYLQREFTGLSLIKIAENFNRDHTTALHGIKKIEQAHDRARKRVPPGPGADPADQDRRPGECDGENGGGAVDGAGRFAAIRFTGGSEPVSLPSLPTAGFVSFTRRYAGRMVVFHLSPAPTASTGLYVHEGLEV